MFFILRAAFWLTIVFLAMPPENRPALAGAVTPAVARTIAARAEKNVIDACVKRPKSCIDGAVIAQEFGSRATRAFFALASLADSEPAKPAQVRAVTPPAARRT